MNEVDQPYHHHHGDAAPSEPLLDRIERFTALPMLLLSVSYVPALIFSMIDTSLDSLITRYEDGIWLIFFIEYAVRFGAAKHRKYFVRHNLIDLATIVLPMLRPLRLASSVRALRMLRIGAIVAAGLRSGKQTERLVNGRSVAVTAMVAVSIVAGCAAVVYNIEHNAPGANIHTVGDAFWWAMVTVASVGYGDRYPVTAEGRLVAAGLMVVGICLVGLIAAAFTSVFVEQREEDEFDPQLQDLRDRLHRLELVLTALDERLSEPRQIVAGSAKNPE